jgi:hypothetical protein
MHLVWADELSGPSLIIGLLLLFISQLNDFHLSFLENIWIVKYFWLNWEEQFISKTFNMSIYTHV